MLLDELYTLSAELCVKFFAYGEALRNYCAVVYGGSSDKVDAFFRSATSEQFDELAKHSATIMEVEKFITALSEKLGLFDFEDKPKQLEHTCSKAS